MKHYENDDDHLGVDPSSHSVQRQTPTTTTPELKEIKGIQTQARRNKKYTWAPTILRN